MYRHFPTREALLDTLEAEAREQLATRIADAGLDLVPVPEALGRLLRAIFTVGDRYLVLRRERTPPPGEPGPRVGAPILALFQRGIDDRTLRDDLSASHLGQLFGGLVQSAPEGGETRDSLPSCVLKPGIHHIARGSAAEAETPQKGANAPPTSAEPTGASR